MKMARSLLPLSGYESEAAALFARFTVPPTDERRRLINRLIRKLKVAGVWSLLDALYLNAAADDQCAKLNWKSAAFGLVQIGAVAHVADRGHTGDGSTGYLGTSFAPNVVPSNYALNSAHISVWCRNNIQSSTQIPIGGRTTSTTAQSLIVPRLGTDVATHRMNQDAAGAQPASVDSIGHWLARRSAAGVNTLFRNGAVFSADTQASVAAPNVSFTLCALNTGGVIGSFSTHQIAAASIGGGLSDFQVFELYAGISQYLQAIGA